MQSEKAILETDLNLPGRRAGKVRDIYDLPPDEQGLRLLIVATDRISAFDVVMPTPIGGKGRLLTELSTFWLRFIASRGITRTHLLSVDAGEIPESAFRGARTSREDLAGRIMIARKARVVPVECVVRGYLEGSGWKEYQQTGSVCGVKLPPGLRQCDRLAEPIFTPATKEEMGKHDENVTFERASAIAGADVLRELRERSLAIYRAASEHALARGIIIADTKFEFGMGESGEILLVDEALTPDSSRFWPAETYRPGAAQQSFDKQYLREYLEELVREHRWDKQSPGPLLPPEIVVRTADKYRSALERLAH
ncbi:MAG: phosphoribosylaminoimidazolesuccinocarboxamide synthase [Phycisphaerales bacterium]|nr:phosphoribosylaminoimidazolesuccinocarboxamide synthase [Planctomycetota bacterium]